MGQISPELRLKLTEWLAAKPNVGLCDWVGGATPDQPYQRNKLGTKLISELQEMFQLEGLDLLLPFNESYTAYRQELKAGTAAQNPKRRAWVKAVLSAQAPSKEMLDYMEGWLSKLDCPTLPMTKYGLCYNVFDTNPELRLELRTLLRVSFGVDIYPFGGVDVSCEEFHNETAHLNPERKAWVKSLLAKHRSTT